MSVQTVDGEWLMVDRGPLAETKMGDEDGETKTRDTGLRLIADVTGLAMKENLLYAKH